MARLGSPEKLRGSLQSLNAKTAVGSITKKNYLVQANITNKQRCYVHKLGDRMEKHDGARKRMKVVDDELERNYKDNDRRIEAARDKLKRDLEECIAAQDKWKATLNERLAKLNEQKQSEGNVHAAANDDIIVNAGGRVIYANRSILTQQVGTRFEAIFSGRWDKKLQRDSDGVIFLDVNPDCFQAIVTHLHEMMIASENDPPNPPSVEDEGLHSILQDQLELFGFVPTVEIPDSIIKDVGHCIMLHDWLKEDDSDGAFTLLYRRSRDGHSGLAFHSKCENKGPTLTIIETTCGRVIGGYTNTSWSSGVGYCKANKAFLFALSGSNIPSPCKMKLKNANDSKAIWDIPSFCPTFGGGFKGHSYVFDMDVVGYSTVSLNPGHTYHAGSLPQGKFTIKEMEVFQVTGSPPSIARIATSTGIHPHCTAVKSEPVTRFTEDINEAINAKQECLLRAEAEMVQLEERFNDEKTFIEKFASGDATDVIVLDVFGNRMVTTRSTLCIDDDCMLARQFDNSKWTEQDSSTLIEFNPYCFGKVLDHLRLKRLHSLGLIANEPTFPKVRDSHKKSFENCVNYYFPRDDSK